MSKTKYVLIIITAFIIGFETNIGHPITPYLVKTQGFPEYSFSWFFSLMSLGMLITAPLWGMFSDRRGNRLTFFICAIGYSIGQMMFGLFDNLYLVYFARFFSGCFSSGMNVFILSYIATSRGLKEFKKERLIPMALSFQLVGQAFGNFFGGKLGDVISYNQVLFVQAGSLALLGLIVFLFFGFNDDERVIKERKNFIQNLLNVRQIGLWMILFLITLTIFSLVFSNVTKYLDYYYSDLGKTSGELGNMSLVVGGVTLITNLLITPFMLQKLKPIPTMIVSGIFGTIMLFITFINKDENFIIMVYSTYMLFVMTKPINESASANYISSMKNQDPGLILGVRQSFISLGAVVGPLLGGLIYYSQEVANRKILFFVCAGLYAVGVIILLGIYAYRFSFKSYKGDDLFENKG